MAIGPLELVIVVGAFIVVGFFLALAVVTVVLFLSRSNAPTQPDDDVFQSGSQSDNPYASSNVAPQRGRRNPWVLTGVAILACIACVCPLSGVFVYLSAPMPASTPVTPAPRPGVETAPADGGSLEAADQDDVQIQEKQ